MNPLSIVSTDLQSSNKSMIVNDGWNDIRSSFHHHDHHQHLHNAFVMRLLHYERRRIPQVSHATRDVRELLLAYHSIPIPMISFLFPFPVIGTLETSITFPFIPEKQFPFPPIPIWTRLVSVTRMVKTLESKRCSIVGYIVYLKFWRIGSNFNWLN